MSTTTDYQLTHKGSEIDSILANAAADHNKIGAASGIAPLGADGKVPDANLPSYAPLGADGKVPAANLPDNDATLRFSAVERVPGATITQGTATGSFEVVWLDNRALATSHPYTAPTTEEKELSGRFVAKTGSGIQLTEASGGDVSTTTYYSNWGGRDKFCNSAGKPLKNRLYLCTSTGRQYDKFPGNNSTGLRCIAAPPMDAKTALFNDLWNEACFGFGNNPQTIEGYYDEDTAQYVLNGMTLSYAEALCVFDAGKMRGSGNTLKYYAGNLRIRTNLPPVQAWGSNLYDYSKAFTYCSNLEVANIGLQANKCAAAFHGCNKLTKVIGKIWHPEAPVMISTPTLTEIHFYWNWDDGNRTLNITNIPNISKESLQWMITNAATNSPGVRTVTLHADAYARLTDDMKALAAEKSITFVCAS